VLAFGNFAHQLNFAMLTMLMKIKELFLLVFSLLSIVFGILPASFYQRRNGERYDDLLFRRIACAGIGIAILFLWYSLPQSR
jgi:hypothetical protein